MVSALWKACADGDAAKVDEYLADATSVDIEIKDHTGGTPLIQAIKGGHLLIVKALLAKGADPNNASSQGRPETYTTDPEILHELATARGDLHPYPEPAYYAPYNPYAYAAYPEQWYPPPPPPQPTQDAEPQPGQNPTPPANLPPPEVARNIPCRCVNDFHPTCLC
ncbi:hypothetical protein M422DRAFT_785778 [Sphaerobolus stellatus SS14]|uniref:Uncharacterized protein n=1 Tax=Sphaerobolus stellatus (strain SS14) TaxID=990650 RepID=A0A0C9T735_SPHS4|nr:hypothetical protein M422DRAFT_785778 [Sphaerobolus stellatus SS14]